MKLTVAICTWNRARLLAQTLNQMTQLRQPEGGWELLVVNNNCTDATDSVLEEYADRLPLRRCFECRPGQTNARNHAIREAKGTLIIWTDDDVLVDSEWLTEYRSAAIDNPGCSFFGGPVKPWFETPPPNWLETVFKRVESAYASRDLGETPFSFTTHRTPFGANYAIRTETQRRYLYDPDIGLRPGSTMRGDEVTVLRQLLSDGHSGIWVPGARVRHYIPRERMRTAYLSGYFEGQGQFLAKSTVHADCAQLLGAPRWILRKAIMAEIRYRVSRSLQRPEVWIERLIEKSHCWGQVKAARRQPRSKT